MATITGLTKTAMDLITAMTLKSAAVVGDNLEFTRNNNQTFIAGNVRGPKGDPGASGLPSGGTDGQFLKKSGTNGVWSDLPIGAPTPWIVVGSGTTLPEGSGTAPAFQGTWAESSGLATTKFRKNGFNVDVSLAIVGSTGGNSDPVFVLPAGYRPSENVRAIIMYQAGTNVPATCDVTTTGEVRVFRLGASVATDQILAFFAVPIG